MRRLAILLLSAGLMASCSGGTHSLVAPLPCGYDLLDTRVLVEGGIITEITRHWIP